MQILQSMLSQLGINESIFVMLGLFVVTFIVMDLLALGKLSTTLIERDERTEGREEESHALRAEIEKAKTTLTAQMQDARKVAATEFLNMKARAADEQRTILGGARETASNEMRRVREDVSRQLSGEMKKLESEVPEISRAILDRLMSAPKLGGGRSSSIRSQLE